MTGADRAGQAALSDECFLIPTERQGFVKHGRFLDECQPIILRAGTCSLTWAVYSTTESDITSICLASLAETANDDFVFYL